MQYTTSGKNWPLNQNAASAAWVSAQRARRMHGRRTKRRWRAGFVMVETTVSDTGIGHEYLPTLFEPFTRERNTKTGKISGTGLGMTIVKKLVDMLGGTIRVESEPGKGSRFAVTLKHRIADEIYYGKPSVSCAAVMHTDILAGKRILLAEDNELNAEIAVYILEKLGMTVDLVEDGVQCVSRMEVMPAGTYDLILMDIQMPHMDGYKASQGARTVL